MKHKFSFSTRPALAWLATAAFCGWIFSALNSSLITPGSAQETSTPAAPEAEIAPAQSPIQSPAREPSPLDAIAVVMRSDGREAARRLKAMNPKDLRPDQVFRYFQLASRAALRAGDRAWLEQLSKDEPSLRDSANDLLILGAMRSLLAADFAGARRNLEHVFEPEHLGEIPRRRYLELYQKLEQLENKPHAERVHANTLVSFVAQWPSANCQSCHANPKKYGDAVTTLDLKNLWFGERYSALLKTQGDAQKVRDEAETVLQKKPTDEAARIRLAFALRALGDEGAMENELRKILWSQAPDREIKTPLRFGQFP